MNTTDDRDGDLFRPLRGIDGSDGPPPRYDLDLAMRQGDSIRVRRMSLGAFVAVAVVALAIGIPLGLRNGSHNKPAPTTSSPAPSPSASTPQPEINPAELPVANCTTTTLTAPASAGAFTTMVAGSFDPAGRYLAVSLVKPFTLPPPNFVPAKALLIDLQTGAMTLLPVAEGGPTAVNASGVVLGSSGPNDAGWIYRNGKVTQLPKYRGQVVEPWGMNSRGDIVGRVTIGKTETSVILPAGHPGTVRPLKPAGFEVDTITDTGTVAGAFQNKPYVGDGNGSGHTLPTGATDPRGEVYQIRGDYAVGWGLADTDQGLFPMVWNLRTGVRTPYPRVPMDAIASDGTSVGVDNTGTGNGDAASFGIIARNGTLKRLPSGISGNLPLQISDITADGHTIYGFQHTDATTTGPVHEVGILWRC
jgi:hypothetical protein